MNENKQILPMDVIDLNQRDTKFASDLKARSGVDANLCWHCKTCVNGCPFFDAMDYAPNEVIRLVQLGLKREALDNATIWLCVGCNTCSIQCPNAIDVAAINDALREMAIEDGITVSEPDILKFHREVLNSIERYGKTHKLEIMLRYKAYKRDFFGDFGVGLKMMAKRKLEILPSKNRDMQEIKRIFREKMVA